MSIKIHPWLCHFAFHRFMIGQTENQCHPLSQSDTKTKVERCKLELPRETKNDFKVAEFGGAQGKPDRVWVTVGLG